MLERLRRWLCLPPAVIQFRMRCNHCEHVDSVNAQELTVQVTEGTARTFLAGTCGECERPMAVEVTLGMCDLAMKGGARLVHLVESAPINERDIRKFMRSVDDEYTDLCEAME